MEPTALQLGDHACHVYATRDARARALAAFLRTGIDRGELCVAVMRSAAEARALPSELASEGFETAALAAAGALVIADGDVFFGPRFEPDRALVVCAEATAAARAAGFAGLRIAFEAAWILGAARPEALTAFEAGLGALRGSDHRVVLCQYDPDCCEPALLQEVTQGHPRALQDAALRPADSGSRAGGPSSARAGISPGRKR